MKPRNELILHPVRLRILIALAGREMTAKMLAEQLSDIPQATLYRQINRLVKEKALLVIHERQVRGAVERTYKLNEAAASFTVRDLAGATSDDHVRYFTLFVRSLLADFTRYSTRQAHDGKLDVAADGVVYSTIPLNLSDEEYREVGATLRALLGKLADQELTPERRRRLFSLIVIPDDPATT